MKARQEAVLSKIIDAYFSTAQPVGSKILADGQGLEFSPATIRSEMAVLEKEGLIAQPHTSAGRIPTIKGITYYLEHLMKPQALSADEEQRLMSMFQTSGLKGLARMTAEYCHSACILVLNLNEFYYTGFAYLLAQPEFENSTLIHEIGVAIDNFESALPHFVEHGLNEQPRIFLGEDNPLGQDCSATLIAKKGDRTVLGVLSPVRTDYRKNVSLLTAISHYF